MQRRRLVVRGVVQGVGFRPFVAGLARRLGLGGLVRNDSGAVVIEIEGPDAALDAFAAALNTRSVLPSPRSTRSRRVEIACGVATSAFVIDASASHRAADGRRFRLTSPPATPASASCTTRPTVAIATRS